MNRTAGGSGIALLGRSRGGGSGRDFGPPPDEVFALGMTPRAKRLERFHVPARENTALVYGRKIAILTFSEAGRRALGSAYDSEEK